MVRLQPSIIERIRTLQWRRGWTGNELELRAKLSHGYLSQMLNGKRLPSLETLDRIEKALGEPILTIAGRKPQRTKSGRSYGKRKDPKPLTYEQLEALEFEMMLTECG